MFDITTSRDFYAKLVADFDDFMAQPDSARHALNCAISAYHLYEWVWGDWLKTDYETQKLLGIRDRDSFAAWVRRACVWFVGVQDLANGTKHFIRDQGFETMRVSGYGQGPYGIGPYGKGYLVIDYGEDAGEHRWMPAAHLLEVVVRFWRDFFKKYRPGEDIPVSAHHVD
ncbi:MAG: hypothetical protein K2X72_06220 [Reyranella sp.]|nr:hypothetical protein [Reyranella sp.]